MQRYAVGIELVEFNIEVGKHNSQALPAYKKLLNVCLAKSQMNL